MIQANELRIWNRFQDKEGNILTCQGVCKGGKDEPTIVWYDVDNGLFLDIDECLPIPLTEEWLVKLGFVDMANDKKQWSLNKQDCDFWIFYDFTTKHYYYQFENYQLQIDDIIISSVHQLQNLYFALTGKELEVR